DRIDSATGVFTWTPTEAQGPGVYAFTVLVSDGQASDSKTIVLTVAEVNVAPVLGGVPSSATIDEEQPYTFTATASDHDLPAQTLTFSLNGAQTGTRHDPTTGAFTWPPSAA